MEQADFPGDRLRSVGSQEMPDLSCRQLAAWTTDNMGFSYLSLRSTASFAGRGW